MCVSSAQEVNRKSQGARFKHIHFPRSSEID